MIVVLTYIQYLKYNTPGLKSLTEFNGKPVVFDDTVYFLSCFSEEEAHFVARLLRSELAVEFYNSLIFWEDKRPITVDVLKKLSLRKLAKAFNEEDLYIEFVLKRGETTSSKDIEQLRLLERQAVYSLPEKGGS